MFSPKYPDSSQMLSDHFIDIKNQSVSFSQKASLVNLKIHSNTGSQINPTRPPILLIDPRWSESYISNYPDRQLYSCITLKPSLFQLSFQFQVNSIEKSQSQMDTQLELDWYFDQTHCESSIVWRNIIKFRQKNNILNGILKEKKSIFLSDKANLQPSSI